MEKRKKIIFTVTNDLTYDRRMQRICTTLAKNGFDVLLVGRKLLNSEKSHFQYFNSHLIKCLFNKKFVFYAEYNIRLFFFLLFKKYDIICGVDLDTLPAAWLSSRVKGKKCFYDAHEYFPEVIEVQNRKFVKSFWLAIERFLVPKVDKVYTVSNHIAETFRLLYKRNVFMIRNLPEKYEPEQVEEKHGILYQGALNEGRGLENLISAMQFVDSNLLIVGDGYLKPKLEKQVKELRLESKITFSGMILPADLHNITAGAKIGISFLENKGASYYYSLSNKFFDYIMAEKPQIGSNFPEYKAINDSYKIALLLDDISINSISKAINKLLKDNNLYNTIKVNCKIARQELCWEEEQKKLIQIYQNASK